MEIPQFESKAERIAFVVENKAKLIAEKKMTVKYADAFVYSVKAEESRFATKATASGLETDPTTLKAELIINTTNVMDSHSDVHIPGIWTKSLKEVKNDLYLLKEHSMSFETIISDEVKASAKYYDWKELGFNIEGKTQALLFKANIHKEQHEFMFEKYLKGQVKNHSVGMRYVKLALAVNSEDYPEEKAVWDKYINQMVNPEVAEAQGYFYAVTEAKVLEGSAVPIGSNRFTPTQAIESKDNEPSNEDTQRTEPGAESTHKTRVNNFI